MQSLNLKIVKKPQYITIVAAAVLLIVLLAFGKTYTTAKPAEHHADDGHDHSTPAAVARQISVDTLLAISKKSLTPDQANRISLLENSITRGDVQKQKLQVYHQLTHFWKDSAKSFIPYAWYTGEAARLENSEKNLTFAGQLFLDQSQIEENEALRHWMAGQAKDLFERSLKVNPNSDSSKVGLGAAMLYGGLGSPMESIAKIREVVDKDSTNVYAQMTLATASLMSGQQEKAIQRLKTVAKLQPENLQALLMLGDLYERGGNKTEAIQWYDEAVKHAPRADIRRELEKRITELKK